MKNITPDTTIRLPEINLPAAGLAHIRVGVLYAIDVLQQAVRKMNADLGILQEPEYPPGEFPAGRRVSMQGLKRGTDAYRAADAHNKKLMRDARRAAEEDEEESLIPLRGLKKGSKAYTDGKRQNQRVYYQRGKLKQGGSRSRHESGAMGWAGMTAEERSKEMKRRRAVAKAKRGIEKLRNAAKDRWARMTRAQREQWKAGMLAGREAAAKAKYANGAAS